MQMEEYLLKLGPDAASEIQAMLRISFVPTYIRMATLAPLSNYGYPEGAEGALLFLGDRGVVIGVADDEAIPRDFVPWQNISYITDGTSLAKERS